MFQEAEFNLAYIEEVQAQVLELPYAGKELSMLIVLPDDGVDLSSVRWAQWLSSYPSLRDRLKHHFHLSMQCQREPFIPDMVNGTQNKKIIQIFHSTLGEA